MKRFLWSDLKAINYLENVLKNGQIALTSTDTVLGLLADISEHCLNQLNSIKKRTHKPYLILVTDVQKALQFISNEKSQSFQIEKLMNFCWPGPMTLICNAKKEFPSFLKSDKGAIALRVPDHKGLQKILNKFDGLFSTSANITGKPIPTKIDDIDKEILNKVSVIVVDTIEQEKETLPSTILDCTSDTIKVVREGAFSIKEIEQKLTIKITK